MHPVEIVTLLLALTTLLAVIARRINISYPILLVIAGLVIGWIPGLPTVQLAPDVVFLVFLPPLLYSAAWAINNAELKRYRRSVILLAVGLVTFTSTIVAIVATTFIPGFTLAQGYLLGAIISPPDAVAASSVLKGFNVPKRINTILEGESLVNDSSSLIIYRFALSAIMTGEFGLWEASFEFIWSAVASIAIGLAIGWVMQFVHRSLGRDTVSNTAVTLLIPFGAYLLAEQLELSGVLAVVMAGLFLSWRAPDIFTHQGRIQAYSVWDIVTFLLNGLVFVLIGLQLPAIVSGLNTYSLGDAIAYTLLISAVTIVVRILWVYPGAFLPRILNRHIREREPKPKWREVAIVGWAGMRGVVSLAAALAIPNTLPNGQPFPGRDLILFITFGVIFCTLVLQGLTLPLLIRWLGVQSDTDERKEEHTLRLQMAQAAITYLESNHSGGTVSDEVLNYVKNAFEMKVDHLNRRIRTDLPSTQRGNLYDQAVQLQLELLSVERSQLDRYRKEGIVSDELIRQMEQELDLEAARLTVTEAARR